jgi:hypothetical protein
VKTPSLFIRLLVLPLLVGASSCSRQSTELTRGASPSAVSTRHDAARNAASLEAHASTAAPAQGIAQAPVGPSTRNAAPLPEDPEAGKRAEAQWREHLAYEERERVLNFDKRRLKEHHALFRRIKAVRARVMAARTPTAVAKLQSELPKQIEQLQGGIKQVDPWGVTSRLLPDYQVLVNLLQGPLGKAKAEALAGHPDALAAANASFNERLEHMEELLEEAEESEETY